MVFCPYLRTCQINPIRAAKEKVFLFAFSLALPNAVLAALCKAYFEEFCYRVEISAFGSFTFLIGLFVAFRASQAYSRFFVQGSHQGGGKPLWLSAVAQGLASRHQKPCCWSTGGITHLPVKAPTAAASGLYTCPATMLPAAAKIVAVFQFLLLVW